MKKPGDEQTHSMFESARHDVKIAPRCSQQTTGFALRGSIIFHLSDFKLCMQRSRAPALPFLPQKEEEGRAAAQP